MKIHLIAAATFSLLASSVLAETGGSDDMANATCGDYLSALKRANPGKSPTEAEVKAAKSAQDALVDIAVWAHGYQSGRTGPNAQLLPFDNSYIEAHVVRLARQCTAKSPDGKMPIVDILRTF
jgi:hypothetical protein